ncbi:short coiled-coil protein homolog [Belonocnema kinseyi]|uniref:short coiled-coil protein homolog n=1 Tax=Belonocnema kinseyi TaxID=2817044 RepID=UPI00143D197A|nr:short coiled-coil protein homolog [Belonocnema kinseyi]
MSTSMMSGAKLQDDMSSIPLADDDPQVIIPEEENDNSNRSDVLMHGRSMDSIPSTFTNGSCSPNSLDPDISPDEQEEKARLISQVLELQNTLDDLSQRVDSVKEENLKLRSENQVLGQYIENLMSASSVFQSTSPKSKKNFARYETQKLRCLYKH